MKSISYEGYLTEIKLKDILITIFGSENVKSQFPVKIKNKTYKIDYKVIIQDYLLFIEFNGYGHYTKSSTQVRDLIIQDYCDENQIRFIELPYWLQFDERIFIWAFGIDLYNEFYKDKIKENKNLFPN